MLPTSSRDAYPPDTNVSTNDTANPLEFSATRMNITDLTVRIPGSERSARARSRGAADSVGGNRTRTAEGEGAATGPATGQRSSLSGSTPPLPPPPPRWGTLEFRLYAVVFVLVVPMIVYTPIRLSSMSDHNYPLYAHRLSPGWLFGRLVDNSDAQYSSFRNGLPGLLSLGTLHIALSHVHRRVAPSPSARTRFLVVSALLVLVILHGLSAAKVVLILLANYHLAVLPKEGWGWGGKMWPGVVIGGNMGVLLLNERWSGYPLGAISGRLAWLDEWDGLLPGWQNHFKITMLRIVSFALDYHWRTASTAVDAPTEYRSRVNRSVAPDQYSLANFLAYALYPPLYIAGPIMTFNDFTWQIQQPATISMRERVSYAVRFVACFLTMETVLHTMYVVAIKDAHAWDGSSAGELCMMGFWNLIVVWLKLLIPWRFFRLWSILDGVDPPENMVRCVANNYSTLGFWRSWHRSYNLWVVRYIYIPVGGGRNAALATLLVFTFVALWHDLSFRLLAWGWLVSLFILPELVARRVLPADRYGARWWYRHVAALGGVGNVLMMMAANLVGFVLGIEGMREMLGKLVGTAEGWAFGAFACACLFVGVQIMFEYREEELRRGIDRRC